MSEAVTQRPFRWSEIHSISRDRLKKLDKSMRTEISNSQGAPPPSGGDRYRYFVLLGERADDYATQAKDAYLACLTEIGREASETIRVSIWENGLRFFIAENLRQFLILACEIAEQDLRWAETGSEAVRNTPHVKSVLSTVREIDAIVSRVSRELEVKMSSSGDWLTDMSRLLETVGNKSKSSNVASFWSAIRDRQPGGAVLKSLQTLPGPSYIPTSKTGHVQPPGLLKDSYEMAEKRKRLLEKMRCPDSLENWRYEQVALALNISKRSVERRLQNGELKRGSLRGTVSSESLKALLDKRSGSDK